MALFRQVGLAEAVALEEESRKDYLGEWCRLVVENTCFKGCTDMEQDLLFYAHSSFYEKYLDMDRTPDSPRRREMIDPAVFLELQSLASRYLTSR